MHQLVNKHNFGNIKTHGTNLKTKMKIMFIVISAPCCMKPIAVIQREAVCIKFCRMERLYIRKSHVKLTQMKYNREVRQSKLVFDRIKFY